MSPKLLLLAGLTLLVLQPVYPSPVSLLEASDADLEQALEDVVEESEAREADNDGIQLDDDDGENDQLEFEEDEDDDNDASEISLVTQALDALDDQEEQSDAVAKREPFLGQIIGAISGAVRRRRERRRLRRLRRRRRRASRARASPCTARPSRRRRRVRTVPSRQSRSRTIRPRRRRSRPLRLLRIPIRPGRRRVVGTGRRVGKATKNLGRRFINGVAGGFSQSGPWSYSFNTGYSSPDYRYGSADYTGRGSDYTGGTQY